MITQPGVGYGLEGQDAFTGVVQSLPGPGLIERNGAKGAVAPFDIERQVFSVIADDLRIADEFGIIRSEDRSRIAMTERLQFPQLGNECTGQSE